MINCRRKRFSRPNESGNSCPCERCRKEVQSLRLPKRFCQLEQTWPKEIVVMTVSCLLLLLVVAIREAEYSFVCFHLSRVQLRLAFFFSLYRSVFFSRFTVCFLSLVTFFSSLFASERERGREKERNSDEVVVIHSFLLLSVRVFAHHHHHHCRTRGEAEEGGEKSVRIIIITLVLSRSLLSIRTIELILSLSRALCYLSSTLSYSLFINSFRSGSRRRRRTHSYVEL